MSNRFRGLIGASRQRGIATVLIMLLMGLGVTVTALGVIHHVRSTQDRVLSVHAATQAQQRAWNGVEIVRGYLAKLDAESIGGLSGQLRISGIDHLEARITGSVTNEAGTYRVPVSLTGVAAADTPAQAKATLMVVYALTPDASGNRQSVPKGITIFSDVLATGNTTVTGGENISFNVEGDVELQGSVSGIETIRATGNVTVGSAITVASIHSNENVTLSGAANVGVITAVGSVTLSGGTKAGTIRANGDVVLSSGSASATKIESKGNVTISGGAAKATTIRAEGYVDWTSSASSTEIQSNSWVTYAGGLGPTSISANGNVTLTGAGANVVSANGNVSVTWGTIGQLFATGNLSAANGNVSTGTIGGNKTCPTWNPCPNVATVAGYVVNPTLVALEQVETITIERPQVDAYQLKDEANFVFEVDSNGYRKVTVNDYHGIESGTYYLADYSDGHKDYLCTAISGSAKSPTCTKPVTPLNTICRGYSAYNGCVTYDQKKGEWTLAGKGFAPGVLWFEGNLVASNGVYYNTMIASGNISTSGNTLVYALNFAGQGPVCNNTPIAETPETRFSGYYPASYCNGGEFESQPLGNIAFLAGGYVNGTYAGGDISLGSSNDVYGSVMAGNLLTTGGNTTVHGSITVAALRQTGTTKSTGNTSMDFSSLPKTYDPTEIPCTDNCEATDASAKVLWSRYD